MDKDVNIRLHAYDYFTPTFKRLEKELLKQSKTLQVMHQGAVSATGGISSFTPTTYDIDMTEKFKGSMTDAIQNSMLGTNQARAGWTSFSDTLKRDGVTSMEMARKKAKSLSYVLDKSMKKSLAESAHNAKRLRGNLLGAGLGMLFLGMAIQRYSMNMLKGLFKTYSTIMGEGTKFNEQTNSLSAAFEFLKFSIMDALGNSELFAALVEWIVGAVNWISEFISLHPWIGKVILGLLIMGVVVGSLMLIYGQFFVLAKLMMLSHTDLMAGGTKNIHGNWGKMITGMKTGWTKFVKWAGGGAMVALAAALILAFAFIFNNWQKKVGGWSNFWKGVLIGMVGMVGMMADAIVLIMAAAIDVLLLPLRAIIGVHNALVRKFGGEEIEPPHLAQSWGDKAFGAGEGVAGTWMQNMMARDFFAGVGQAWSEEQSGSLGTFLNPFTEGTVDVGDFDTGTYTPDAYTPEEMTNVMNNAFDINIEVEGLSPQAQQNIIDAVITQLEEEGFLTGGSPQS